MRFRLLLVAGFGLVATAAMAQGGASAPSPQSTRPAVPSVTAPITRYPAVSFLLGEEGTARVDVVVKPDGSIAKSAVDQSSGSPRLDKASVNLIALALRGALAKGTSLREGRADVVWKLPHVALDKYSLVPPLPDGVSPSNASSRPHTIPNEYPLWD